MDLLTDENFPRKLVDSLRSMGHDVTWALTACRGWRDVKVLDLAEAEGRILLTLDNDFVQLGLQRRHGLRRGGVVLFRAPKADFDGLLPLLLVFVNTAQIWSGRVAVITRLGVEFRST